MAGAQLIPATWHETFEDIPTRANVPAIVIGNEFFDALPIRQFERGEKGWAERLVGVDAKTGALGFVRGAETPVTDALIPAILRGSAKKGDISEPGWFRQIAPSRHRQCPAHCAQPAAHRPSVFRAPAPVRSGQFSADCPFVAR